MTIAIYSRKSRFTGKGDSIANQIELCKQESSRYLLKKGIPESEAVILVYEDEGFSGKNTLRPEYQRLMSDIRANMINCVVCYKLDRISRNVGDFARTCEDFERRGVDFLCVNERYDTSTPAGRAMMSMVSVFAQLERETTAERIRDNMHMLARSGRWLGGHTPTGFRSEKEERADVSGKLRSLYKLVPDKCEMDLVRFIFEKFMELQSVSGTARYLVRHDIRTRNNKDFTNTAVKGILRNPVYCIAARESGDYFEANRAEICYEECELDNKHGFMPYNRTSCGKTQQSKNDITDWMIAVGKHSGIIPAKAWVKTQLILNGKRERSKAAVRTPYKSEALLSGILICDKCRGAMRPHVHTGRRRADGRIPYYYICELKERSFKKSCDMRNANGLVLDRIIMDELTSRGFVKAHIYRSLCELSERLAQAREAEPERQGFVESELAAKQREINNLLDALAKDGAQDIFAQQVRARVNELAAQCKELETEIGITPCNTLNAKCADRAKGINTIAEATVMEKRELLKATVERIVWDGVTAHIFVG